MAKAVKQEKQVELREVVTQEEAVVLTLSIEEAQTLLDITRGVGGDPYGRRRHIAALTRALKDSGVSESFAPSSNRYRPSDIEPNSSIYFK